MTGNKLGGMKAREKNLAKDPDFYKNIGSKGGKGGAGKIRGFALSHKSASKAGRKGGLISKRRKKTDDLR